MQTASVLPRQRKLLVVDDDANSRRLLQSLLENAGYRVLTATDGEEGYRCVTSERPDIVITDWMMPKVDGIEMIRKIRAQLNWYPYIVLVTCKTDQQLGLDMGADDFILKPIRREQLLPRIRAGERIVTLQERLREKNLELNQVNQQLAQLATTDPLTGLLNRRAFFEEARHEWLRAARYDLPLSCLMIDIDYFKSVNDTYGHAAGDNVLRQLAAALTASLRETDVCCRYGGEEFCAFLVNTPVDMAAQLANRLRCMTSELRVEGLPKSFSVSISLGIASRTLQSLSEQSLIDQADQALLFAKRNGRDRWVRFDQLPADWKESDGHRDLSRENQAASIEANAIISFQLVNTLLGALSHRDPSSVAHCQRVASLCEQFGHFLGLAPAERVMLEMAALLHEVGKLAMSDQEIAEMNQAPWRVGPAGDKLCQRTLEIVDKCLYNSPLAETILEATSRREATTGNSEQSLGLRSRVLALACYFDDLVHSRGTTPSLSREDALAAVQGLSGVKFDTELIERFCEMLRPQPALAGV
jgi:diguanylate cyclase (GGDEF)-like protein